MTTLQNFIKNKQDLTWIYTWFSGLLLVWIWNLLFLNAPARARITMGFFNTMIICSLVIVFTLLLAWLTIMLMEFLRAQRLKAGNVVISFFLNLIRSIPQIVGLLFGYIFITKILSNGTLKSGFSVYLIMAFWMSLFIFNEVVDLMSERIAYYRKLDFYNAMRVCGISEHRIINNDILLKNSRLHIINKLISVFGMAVFLQCSVDFIISVGLSTQVSAVNLPVTLGSLLAHIDSKQDILAIGYTLTHPLYVWNLFFKHLQGITTAFLMVFTLICMYKISNGYAQRHKL